MTPLWRRIRTLRSRSLVALVLVVLTALIATAALAAIGAKSGLIGKLEGPEVVTDPAKFPKTFKEAPQLALGHHGLDHRRQAEAKDQERLMHA